MIVSCSFCKVEMKAGTLDQHQCSPQLKIVAREELQTTASVIQQLLSQSPENVVELPTGGTVSHTHTLSHSLGITAHFTYSLNVLATDPGKSDTLSAFNWRTEVCQRTVRRRSQEVQQARKIIGERIHHWYCTKSCGPSLRMSEASCW